MKYKKLLFSVCALLCIVGMVVLAFGYRHFANTINNSSFFNEQEIAVQGQDDPFKHKKILLKETVFVFKNQQLLKRRLEDKNNEINNVAIVAAKYLRKNQEMIPFESIGTENFRIGTQDYALKTIHLNFLKSGIGWPPVSRTIYLDYADHKLFMASATGIFSYLDSDDLDQDTFFAQTIPSNITDVITYEEFFLPSLYGIRDLFIHDSKFYISYVAEIEENCFGMAILVADLNLEKLNFKNFFTPKACGSVGYNTGGRIVLYKNNQILFSIGNYNGGAQNKDDVTGKIIAIDINGNQNHYDIISMGHRNPQGLFYNQENDVIFSTEHGPDGGDEVNLNLSPQGEVENYGWPIASYGLPYGFDAKKDKAPKKSHKDYGFIEPLKDFTPSIGISQVIEIDKKFNGIDNKQLFVGAMGGNGGVSWGNQSLNYFFLKDDYSIKEHHIVILEERIRDIIYVAQLNKIILFFETTHAIGVLEAKN